jgi:hypothetical protein
VGMLRYVERQVPRQVKSDGGELGNVSKVGREYFVLMRRNAEVGRNWNNVCVKSLKNRIVIRLIAKQKRVPSNFKRQSRSKEHSQ